VKYQQSAQPKSDIYRDLMPAINSGGIMLLRNSRLLLQLSSSGRHVGRSGRDSIDHAPGAHDDIANAVAGAVLLATETAKRVVGFGIINGYGGTVTWRDDDRPKPYFRRVMTVEQMKQRTAEFEGPPPPRTLN
jgi:hypothetical protein